MKFSIKDLVTFTEEIFNGKLFYLSSEYFSKYLLEIALLTLVKH